MAIVNDTNKEKLLLMTKTLINILFIHWQVSRFMTHYGVNLKGCITSCLIYKEL